MLKEIAQKTGKNILLLSIAILCIVLCGTLYYFYRQRSEPNVLNLQQAQSFIQNSSQISGDGIQVIEESENIVIYISGEVNRPGVYELEKGSRIIDAVRAAEGASAGADLESVNLATLLSDSQHVVIPPKSPNSESDTATAVADNTERNGLININAADKSKLSTLPGIGDVIAEYIITYREENGGFKTIDELKNVQRIGDKTFDKIKDKVYAE